MTDSDTGQTGRSTPRAPGRNGGGKPRVDPKTVRAIRRLARQGLSQGAVAKATGVTRSTVAAYCKSATPPITFDRSKSQAAVEAVKWDAKAARTALGQSAFEEAQRLLGLMQAPHEVIHWDREGYMHRGTLDRPTSGDVKNYAIAVGILVDKHLTLERHDSDGLDLPAVDQWLADRMGRVA